MVWSVDGVVTAWVGRVVTVVGEGVVGLAVRDPGYPRLQRSPPTALFCQTSPDVRGSRTMSEQSFWIKVAISISDDQSSINMYLDHLQSPIIFYLKGSKMKLKSMKYK